MFNSKERAIYRFHNGTKVIGMDPLNIQLKMARYPELKNDIELLRLNNDESLNAYDRLVKTAREVFNLKEFKEEEGVQEGLLNSEIMELLVDFIAFLDDVKKKQEPQQ